VNGFPDNPFWQFSTELYGKSGVAPACLAIQARHGLDVNLILFCCWFAAAGRGSLDEATLGAAMARCAPWHSEIVRALRQVRDRLKGGFPPAPPALAAALRDRILGVEVDCERVEQLVLTLELPAEPEEPGPAEEGPVHAAANLALYYRLQGVELSEADREDLAVILQASFPEAEDDMAALMKQAGAA